MNKTKEQRRKWWYNLTSEQQEAQIHKWQAQKAERRKHKPVIAYYENNPKYPWYKTGVNSKNRAKWLRMIKRKNPWLKLVG